MDIAMNDIPLTLFTTLAPIGAGAFVALFVAFLQDMFSDAELKRIDRLTVIPVLFALVGLGCSFVHLANPGHAFHVMSTFGSTPLANEILAFCIFLGLAIVYWIVAVAGGLKSRGMRKALSCIVAIAGLVSVLFMGMAYFIPAIPTWDSPWSVIQVLGVWLFGGVVLGMLVCTLGSKLGDEVHCSEMVCKAAMGIGAIILLVGTIVVYMGGSSAVSPIIDVEANAASLTAVFAGGLICVAAGAACAFIARGSKRASLLGVAMVLAVVGCFLSRMVFYGMQIGLGL